MNIEAITLILSLYTFAGITTVIIFLWRIPRNCPRCGRKMDIASVKLVCKKCGHVESTMCGGEHV